MSSAPASPFEHYVRIPDLQGRNPGLFRTNSAAYYFIEKHSRELLESGALVRLGNGQRAPLLVNERVLLEQCRKWAEEQ
jgi:hypothetical protein